MPPGSSSSYLAACWKCQCLWPVAGEYTKNAPAWAERFSIEMMFGPGLGAWFGLTCPGGWPFFQITW